MTAERCPRCDRPKLWECPEGVIDCRCAKRFPDHCLKGEDCDVNAIDWRARCLAAEAKLPQPQPTGPMTPAELVEARDLFGDDPTALVTRLLDMLDEANENRRLYYSQRLYLREAQDIARRALVEGLAECERLRAMDSTLSAFDILIGAPSKEMTEADLVEAMARLVTDPPSPMMDAREGAAAREQAIRADAAREERERVVAWLRRDPTMWADMDLADAIERGDHTAHAPGKGGGDQ